MAIYNSYFGFSESPFENKLDQRFLFLGHDHSEVLSALLYFNQEKKGLGMVCGDVGTGKTMLLHSFLNNLPPTVQPIVIANPLVDYQTLLSYIAATLGIAPRNDSLLGLVDRIKEALIEARDQEKTYILIVDEAHMLSDASLEQIRLLSNIETPEGKLMQILLIGQYELSQRLNLPEFRQLRQRININRFLSPLSAGETLQYVEHRLQKVGSSFERCFAPECKSLIHKLSGGVPRRINHLCDTALLVAMGGGSQLVSARDLAKAQEALQTDQIFTPQPPKSAPIRQVSGFDRAARVVIAVLASAFLFTFGWVLGSANFWGGSDQLPGLLSKEGMSQAFQKFWPGPGKPSLSLGASLEANPGAPVAAATPPAGDAGGAPAEPGPPLTAPVAPASIPPVESAPSSSEKPVKDSPLLTSPPPPVEAGKKVSPSAPGILPGARDQLPAAAGQAPLPASGPAKEPVPTVSRNQAAAPKQVEVAKDESLSQLAGRYFPGQVELGLAALILANSQNFNQNKIFTGQKLNLPVIDPAKQTIQLHEGTFYAFFGDYPTIHALQKATSRLSQQNVRYTVMSNETSKEVTFYQVLIGAYGTREDLEEAVARLKGK